MTRLQETITMATLTLLLLLSAAFTLGDRMTLNIANDLVRFAADQRNPCPRGWFQFNSRCFMFVKTARTWPNAERHCQLLGEKLKPVYNTVKYLGANLASVHSYEEFQFLQAVVLVATGSFPLTWIGGFDAVQAKVEKDRLWFWSDGSKFDHESWAEGEPNNRNGAREPCIQINFGAENGWTDESCGKSYPSVCSIRTCLILQTVN
ncbi:ladderlectin-like [Oncorhynchus mykiss]|uniref:ladderlectin-like n=1 Tax=Oncorhynchus mykiss TaxID=8022 RepID=UPI001877CCBA|nr:ladderlectin-like [Oncorhynchus mykiss]